MVMVEDITVFNNRSRDVQMILKEKEDNQVMTTLL